MKSTKILMCAMAVGTMIFAAGKVSAVPGVLTVSGTSLSETDSHPSSGIYAGKVTKYGFKNKDVLNLLAQGTEYWFGGNQGWFTNKASQLAYDPEAFNSDATDNYPYDIYGIFYVTNTSTHASYRLDGYDDGDVYYSFVEFDSFGFYELTGEEMGLGFWHDPGLGENYVESFKENDSKGTYSSKASLHGLLYIHDDPYYYDITDYPSSIFDNSHALIIRGLGTFNYSDNSTTQTESFTVSGSGDGYFSDSDDSYQVISGKVAFKSKGPSISMVPGVK
jgi:hypothetical protein